MSSIIHPTSLPELDSLLAASKGLVIIDFTAAWCGPCKAVAPVFERLSTEYKGVVTFCKVDVDECAPIAKHYGVRAMPTFVFIRDGSKVDEVRGANVAAIEAALKKHSSGSPSTAAFSGTGHTLSGATVPTETPASPFPLPSLSSMVILLALVLWYFYGPKGSIELPIELPAGDDLEM